jgi:hypothetical protein
VQPTPIRSLFLIDLLLLANAADGAAKSYADVERHRPQSSVHAADAYTADESHFDWPVVIGFVKRLGLPFTNDLFWDL